MFVLEGILRHLIPFRTVNEYIVHLNELLLRKKKKFRTHSCLKPSANVTFLSVIRWSEHMDDNYDSLDDEKEDVSKSKSRILRMQRRMQRACRGMSGAMSRLRIGHERAVNFVNGQIQSSANGPISMQLERWLFRISQNYFD